LLRIILTTLIDSCKGAKELFVFWVGFPQC
jgi:hypothetical protein